MESSRIQKNVVLKSEINMYLRAIEQANKSFLAALILCMIMSIDNSL